MSNGFTVLAWVRDDSSFIAELDEARERMEKQLLADFNTLIGVRWNMDMQLIKRHERWYAYGHNNRISVGVSTIRNAIGDLSKHIEFIRGTQHSTLDCLIDYKLCKEKWKVPDQVTESSIGWEATTQPGTSAMSKRPRY